MSEALKFTDERIRAMLDGRRAVDRIKFPTMDGKDADVCIRLLSGTEKNQCRIEAHKYIAQLASDLQYDEHKLRAYDPELFDLENETAIIYKAYVCADQGPEEKPAPFFQGVTAVRSLPSGVIRRLYETYVALENLVDPKPQTVEQLQAIVDELKKTPHPEVFLLGYPPSTLRALLLFMASGASPS